VGSIIEYTYTTTSKNYQYLDDWYFQRELPVMRSHFSLVVLPSSEFAYRIYKSDQFLIDVKQEKGSGHISFAMDSIAGLRDEPYMDAEKDYLQHVEFQMAGYRSQFGGTTKYMTTWDEVTRELMMSPSFGTQLNKHLSNSEALLADVQQLTGPYQKMAAIYNHVYKTFSWNGVYGFATSDGVKEAWEKRKGSTAQINLILINLLKEAGLEVSPLLVSERGHGKVNPNVPFIDQFSKVMAYVTIDGKKYVLDAAGAYTPPFMIPFSVINTNALVMSRKKSGIIHLTEKINKDKNLVSISASVNDDGAIKGMAVIQSSQYARLNRVRAWERNKQSFREQYFTAYQTGMQMDSLEMVNLENDSLPLEQRFAFTVPANANGDYKLINMNFFSGIPKNPFISDIRFTNIDYGCLQNHTVVVTLELPPAFKVESMPRNVRMIMPDTSITFSRIFEVRDKILLARFNIETKSSVFTADDYPYVRDFYKKMADMMNEQVILKKEL
jgi:hypothetical protein